MKFTMNWLKRHLDTDESAASIAERLTAIGLEVESLKDPAASFAPFKVAFVESAQKHPDADRLKVCQVRTEEGVLQVVCGAPNARAGMKAVFAPEGSYIPGLDVTLKKTKIRGMESNGMLVSGREMLLSEDHEGIIEVDEKWDVGTPLAKALGLDDQIIEISLTPNRVDCAGVRGIARDLAAAGMGKLRPEDETPVAGSFASPVGVRIEDLEGCPHFTGRFIRGVKNGPSPAWFQDLLKAVGQKPISALVDVTNFLGLDRARPLHVYDAGKLRGDIVVRTARKGETLLALNGKTYELSEDALAICDDSGVIGLGGIVGGASTGCDENTADVFVEAAYFDPARIARAGRMLQVSSDARYRFERGIDPLSTRAGLEMATRLILEFCGGEPSQIVESGNPPLRDRFIDYNPGYLKQLAGMEMPAPEQLGILAALGFQEGKSGKEGLVRLAVPSWRGDVEGKADLVEEIVRIAGFDRIPTVSVRPAAGAFRVPGTPLLVRARKIRAALGARGLSECITWSFMKGELAARFGGGDDPALTLSNPISADLDRMRPSILPNLIEAAGRNRAQGYPDVALFETGPVFRSCAPEGQDMMAAGIRAGARGPRHWTGPEASREVDIYDAKADMFAALASCGMPVTGVQIVREAPDYYHPGRSGAVRLGKVLLGWFGEIHPAILRDMDVKAPLAGFELFLNNIPQPRGKGGTAKPYLALEPLQPVMRDFAFIVDGDVEADSLVRAAQAADRDLIRSVSLFDVYAGKGVEDGKKSVALSVTIQPGEKSLTDAQLEDLARKVIAGVEQKTGGRLRG